MKLFENIKSSIYNPAYYSELLAKPFSYSFKYFLSLTALLALVGTIFISFSVLPEMNAFINNANSKVLQYYPDNLEITAKGGKISTNVPEPYFIKMPAEFKSGQKTEPEFRKSVPIEEMDNLLVIDTKSPLTIELFKDYKTAALLGRDSLVFYKENGAVNIQPLDEMPDGVMTKAKFSSLLSGLMPYLKVLPYVLVPIVFIALFIGLNIGYLIYLIFGAFVIWIASKIKKADISYGKSYQLGIHAITLGLILESTVFWFYPNLDFSFLFTILMLVIFWINFKPLSLARDLPQPPASGEKIA